MANNMECPNCGYLKNKVTDTASDYSKRHSATLKAKKLNVILRTRKCQDCKKNFRTLEFIIPDEELRDKGKIEQRIGKVLGGLVDVKTKTKQITEEYMNVMNCLMKPYHDNLEMAKKSGDMIWIDQAYAAKREALNGFLVGQSDLNRQAPHIKFRNQYK